MNDQDYLSNGAAAVKAKWKLILLVDVVVLVLFVGHLYRDYHAFSYFQIDFSVPITGRGEIPAIAAGAPFGPARVAVGSDETFDQMGLLVRVPRGADLVVVKSDVTRFLDSYYAKRAAMPDESLKAVIRGITDISIRIRRKTEVLEKLKRQYSRFGTAAFTDLEKEVIADERNLQDLQDDRIRAMDSGKKYKDVKLLGAASPDKKAHVPMALKTILVALVSTIFAVAVVVGRGRR